MIKQKLIDYLRTEGKTDTWVNLYNMFPFRGTEISSKQKSDSVRKLAKRIARKKIINTNKIPKILVFDIETAPLRAYVWRLWQQNVNPVNGMLQSQWFMLTWSAKWLFDEKIYSGKLTPKEVLEEDDSRLTKDMWNLFNEADIVIAHNAINFDVRILNGRFLLNGLNPPTPYQIIDTLKHAKRHFSFPSNKLDYLGEILGLGRKISTDFSLWENCLKGKENALAEMERYNIKDVTLLEDVYLALRAYIKPHPNLNLIMDNEVEACPTCMSSDLTWNGKYHTYANVYNSFTCNSCGSVGRQRKSCTNPIVKRNLTVSIPR